MDRVDEDTIVVGIDGSECSDRALTWAINEAERSGRHLMLVHVWHWSAAAIGAPMPLVGFSDAATGGRRLLKNALLKAESHGIPTVTRLVEGAAVSALSEAAHGAGLLVVGAHGGRAHSLLGSVSNGCIRHARCPVVVIPAVAAVADHKTVRADARQPVRSS